MLSFSNNFNNLKKLNFSNILLMEGENNIGSQGVKFLIKMKLPSF